MPQTPAPDLIYSSDVAEQLGIDRSTLSRWIKDGIAVPAMRMPGKTGAYLFAPEEVQRLKPFAHAVARSRRAGGKTSLYAEPGDCRFVYRFFAADGSCLYVGCTVDFVRRCHAHRRDRSWWPEVARIEAEVLPDEAAGFAFEQQEIRRLNPVHNRYFTDHNTPARRVPAA